MNILNEGNKETVRKFFETNFEADKFGEYKDIIKTQTCERFEVLVKKDFDTINQHKYYIISFIYYFPKNSKINKSLREVYHLNIVFNSKLHKNACKELFRVAYQSREIRKESAEFSL